MIKLEINKENVDEILREVTTPIKNRMEDGDSILGE